MKDAQDLTGWSRGTILNRMEPGDILERDVDIDATDWPITGKAKYLLRRDALPEPKQGHVPGGTAPFGSAHALGALLAGQLENAEDDIRAREKRQAQLLAQIEELQDELDQTEEELTRLLGRRRALAGRIARSAAELKGLSGGSGSIADALGTARAALTEAMIPDHAPE